MAKDSAYTSLRQIPATLKRFDLRVNPHNSLNINLDYGGGKYEDASNFLCEQGVMSYVYDPFNRSKTYNEFSLYKAKLMGVNTITCLNVLNVIKDKDERAKVLRHIRRLSKEGTIIFFQIYEGDKSGKPSKKTSQTNMKTVDYIPEIQAVFPKWEVQRQRNVLIV